eukprot:2353990-Rhodomonas_salina.2
MKVGTRKREDLLSAWSQRPLLSAGHCTANPQVGVVTLRVVTYVMWTQTHDPGGSIAHLRTAYAHDDAADPMYRTLRSEGHAQLKRPPIPGPDTSQEKITRS